MANNLIFKSALKLNSRIVWFTHGSIKYPCIYKKNKKIQHLLNQSMHPFSSPFSLVPIFFPFLFTQKVTTYKEKVTKYKEPKGIKESKKKTQRKSQIN
jgi:hypothetical protein